MVQLDENTSLREVLVQVPAALRVLDAYRVDYACHGTQSLRAATAGLDVSGEELLRQIDDEARATAGLELPSWSEAPLAFIAAHVIETHHAFARAELVRILPLALEAEHGFRRAHPELSQVTALVEALCTELMPHMCREERVLFPFIEELERAEQEGRPPEPPRRGNPMSVLEHEHDHVRDVLAELRQVTSRYAAPRDGPPAYAELYGALERLDRDLIHHMHLENNVLFPRARALVAAAWPR
ncbi:MAG: hemerythrin domain-containing protein [Deltaproteobacteria bacterium]|nr:hemerythrin domain-containing protein [Deltaproteobacteria bacterium]